MLPPGAPPARQGTIRQFFLFQACAGESGPRRLVVLGLDGMDPEIIDLLMSEGRMPNFARMRQEGAYGRLLSSMPMLSPVLRTTIATGKPPDQHGIGHFVAAAGPDGGRLPVTSEMRRVESIWNILSDLDKRVAVVGWWATWPAETVNGVIVGGHLKKGQRATAPGRPIESRAVSRVSSRGRVGRGAG